MQQLAEQDPIPGHLDRRLQTAETQIDSVFQGFWRPVAADVAGEFTEV